jgi:hypothetical protein
MIQNCRDSRVLGMSTLIVGSALLASAGIALGMQHAVLTLILRTLKHPTR